MTTLTEALKRLDGVVYDEDLDLWRARCPKGCAAGDPIYRPVEIIQRRGISRCVECGTPVVIDEWFETPRYEAPSRAWHYEGVFCGHHCHSRECDCGGLAVYVEGHQCEWEPTCDGCDNPPPPPRRVDDAGAQS